MISKLPTFLMWCKDLAVQSIDIFSVCLNDFNHARWPNIIQVMGTLRVLCEAAKSGAAELVQEHLPSFLEITKVVSESKKLMSNTVIRKLRTKLVSRVVLRLLPARTRKLRGQGKS